MPQSGSASGFDSAFALQLLLEIAPEQSVERVLHKLVERGLKIPGVACAQFWLLEQGDLCPSCPHRSECPDPSRCLHLAAGKGVSLAGPGQEAPRFDDPNGRLPLGWGLLGKAVATGQQRNLSDLSEGGGELAGFEWVGQEGIVACSVTPILFQARVLGALVAFKRQELPEEMRRWARAFADHLGVVIANARSFEEVRRLKGQLELRNAYLEEAVVEAKAFGELVGQSAALRQVVRQIEQVAPAETPVLILGETGTGKELVAHEIHRRSPRKGGPLVRVNCAGIPRELFESEFFGHALGAFTGALRDRAGRFETAEGGTLFLDEVGELPLEVQGKLLRVLEEGRYERVGEDRSRRANVRIIAATNRDLKGAMAAGRFLESLYYRLAVFPVQVPPLRARKEDIPLLTRHFLELSARDLKCPAPRLTRAGVAKLRAYDWPGNVRELRNAVERAVILARGGVLEFDLPATPPPGPEPEMVQPPVAADEAQRDRGYLTEPELERRERENLRAILQRAQWKVKGPGGAAELLGVKAPTVHARMKRWGLKRPGREGGL